jgi:predicted kinase
VRDCRRKRIIATLHLICGLPCAGKTTLAKTIERDQSALRLTPDEWILRLHGDDPATARDGAIRTAIEATLMDLALRVLSLGVDVVLDFGVWSRSEREEFRTRAARVGARSELHFLDVPQEVLLARLAVRNADLPSGTFAIDEAELRLWSTWLEPPGADELLPREPAAAPA